MIMQKVTYKEPKNYFNSDMKKVASAYDKKNSKSSGSKTTTKGGKKK